MIRVLGDRRSGNCLKVQWILDYSDTTYAWQDIVLDRGETKTDDFLAINPAGQIPVVILQDDEVLTQSNAIVTFFAVETDLVPSSALDKARMLQWMFWEQYSHEPYIAVRRFHMLYEGKVAAELDPKLFDRGSAALRVMEQQLSNRDYLLGPQISAADLCLLAYTQRADEGGFELASYPQVASWVERSARRLGL